MLFPKEKLHNLELWDQYALKNENSNKSQQENEKIKKSPLKKKFFKNCLLKENFSKIVY